MSDITEMVVKGTPPVEWPIISTTEIAAVVQQLATNNISVYDRQHPLGTLEQEFQKLTGCKYAISFNSGTSALLGAYYGAGLGEGDQVIVPSYTFWATVTPLVRLGAVPVFADIDESTLTLCPRSVESRITPSTKAVVVNHTWGNPGNLLELEAICIRHGLKLIEDASHGHGALYNGRPVGSVGHTAAFSLQANKPVSAGEGGIMVTNDKLVYERATLLGHFGPRGLQSVDTKSLAPFAELGLGYKLRMPVLEAVLALKQIETLRERNQIRRDNMEYLSSLIGHLPGLRTPVEQPGGTHIYYGYKLAYEPNVLGVPADRVVHMLRQLGVIVKIADSHMMHRAPLFNDDVQREHLGWPFTSSEYRKLVDNRTLHLSVTETLVPNLLSLKPLIMPAREFIEQYAEAFKRVWDHMATYNDVQRAAR